MFSLIRTAFFLLFCFNLYKIESEYSADNYKSLMLSLFGCITHSSSLFMGDIKFFAIVN